jgi:hypothetical protein
VHSFTKLSNALAAHVCWVSTNQDNRNGKFFYALQENVAFSVLTFVKIVHLTIFVNLLGFNFTIIGQKGSKYGKKSTNTL